MLLVAVACKQPSVITVGGASADVTVTLVNPTSCESCDPFEDVDTLRVEVWVADEDGVEQRVASDSFVYPDEEPVVSGIEGFGVARIALVGLAGGRVVSAGRTLPIALGPEVTVDTTMVFLPANRALPLTGDMDTPRQRHVVVPLEDGRSLLVGGEVPTRERALASMEVYDPWSGTFSSWPETLAAEAADPTLGAIGDAFVSGGYDWVGGQVAAVTAVTHIDRSGAARPVGDLSVGRIGGCFARAGQAGLVLGGASETYGDSVKPTVDGWSMLQQPLAGLDASKVTGCAALGDSAVYIQGEDAANTGRYERDESDYTLGFTALSAGALQDGRSVRGALLRTLPSGDVWIAGGEDVSGGRPLDDVRVFRWEERRYEALPSLAEPAWTPRAADWPIRPGWLAIGCGYTNDDAEEGVEVLELLDPQTGDALPPIAFDRARPGCGIVTNPDGTVVLTGGWAAEDVVDREPVGIHASIVVPYEE
jgi:hypothetical protein